ncbi:MAG: ComF family protein [Actinobacteria bacterium]|nr:MAG: ComF family protein [Actinomycetota bacterium]
MLDLLLPQRCLACGAGGAQLCARCLAGLPRLRPPLCTRCGAPTQWPVERCRECAGRRLAFASARAGVGYDAAVRALVAAWKEHGLRRLAATAGGLLIDVVGKPDATRLTFVPPDELARRWELPVEPLLRRTRETGRQRGLSRPERRKNVAGAFQATGRVPARIVLVDDVYTSGATASAAASALRAGGARRVDVVTFARALRFG